MSNFPIEPRDFVQSLERGLAVICTFGPDKGTLTLSDVARETGMTRAAARRFLLTLCRLGYVGTDQKTFWLKPKVLELGQRYLSAQPWWHVAQPIVEEAARKTGESCSLCILDRHDIVYVCRVAVNRLIAINLSIGSRLPAYPTAIGRVLMSELPGEQLDDMLDRLALQEHTAQTITDRKKLKRTIKKARSDGYCVVNQELEVGLIGLAVPIQSDGMLAALGISVHSGRIAAKDVVPRFLPTIRDSAERIRAGIRQRLR